MFFTKKGKSEIEILLDVLKEKNYNLYLLCRDSIETESEKDILSIFERKIQQLKEKDEEHYNLVQSRIEKKKEEVIKDYHRWLLVYYAIQINHIGGMQDDKSRTGI